MNFHVTKIIKNYITLFGFIQEAWFSVLLKKCKNYRAFPSKSYFPPRINALFWGSTTCQLPYDPNFIYYVWHIQIPWHLLLIQPPMIPFVSPVSTIHFSLSSGIQVTIIWHWTHDAFLINFFLPTIPSFTDLTS